MILYSLSIGFNRDPLNKDHFKYTYEKDEDFQGFSTIPTIIAHRKSDENVTIPGFPKFNPMMLLYGEEYVELMKPITPDVKLVVEERVADIADKVKMTSLSEESLIKNKETGEVLAKVIRTVIIRGIGGFGYKGGNINIKYPNIPKRAPDAIVEDPTLPS